MHRTLPILLLAAIALGQHYLTTIWSSDPNEIMARMLTVSEGRQLQEDLNRWRFTDEPSHLTPIRVHGGIGPGGP